MIPVSGQDQPGGSDRALEELCLLLEAFASRAQEHLNSVSGTDAEQTGDVATCAWCPLCAVAAFLRGERTELTTRLAERAVALVALLRQLLSDPDLEREAARAHGTEGREATASAEPEEPASKAEPITLRRVPGRVLAERG